MSYELSLNKENYYLKIKLDLSTFLRLTNIQILRTTKRIPSLITDRSWTWTMLFVLQSLNKLKEIKLQIFVLRWFHPENGIFSDSRMLERWSKEFQSIFYIHWTPTMYLKNVGKNVPIRGFVMSVTKVPNFTFKTNSIKNQQDDRILAGNFLVGLRKSFRNI